MNWLDIIIIVLLALAAFDGMATGLLLGAGRVGGVIFGIYVAGRTYGGLAPRLTGVGSDQTANALAFFLIFILVVAFTIIASLILRKVLVGQQFGWLDRAGGVALGFLAAAVILGGMLAAWTRYPVVGGERVLRESLLAGVLARGFPLVLAVLPREFDSIKQFYDRPRGTPV
ncbi:MAG: CvpA family protein [Dehalococcoidia bacterium]|nr:CvpA family protein [Dehalococcoidia bacterium]